MTKRDLNRRLKKIKRHLNIDKKPLTLAKACELFEREEQGEKIDWERYDLSGFEKLLEVKK